LGAGQGNRARRAVDDFRPQSDAGAEANSYLLDAIGLVIIAPGIAFAYAALTSYPVTWKTGVMAVVMLSSWHSTAVVS